MHDSTDTTPSQLRSLLKTWNTPAWDDARHAVVVLLEPRIQKWARSALKACTPKIQRQVDLEDLISEGVLTLYTYLDRWNDKQAKRHDSSTDDQCLSFFHTKLFRRMQEIIEKKVAQGTVTPPLTTLDDQIGDIASGETDPFLLADFFMDVETVITCPIERKALDMRIAGHTYPEIREETGLTYKHAKRVVDTAIERCLAC